MIKKLFVLKSRQKHFWHSCTIIEREILSAFQSANLDHEVLELDANFAEESLLPVKKALQGSSKVALYFLSDILDYQSICRELAPLDNIVYLFPIYGNLTVEQKRWLELGEILRGRKVALLAASPRSQKQIDALMKSQSSFISIFPHQIEGSLERARSAKFVYAGRITPQKNILELMSAFNKALKFDPDLELHIAGNFHDRGYHLHGYNPPIEKYQERFYKMVEAADGKITYHGFLEQQQLLDLYEEMDCFCSVSSYHDEDYGVAAVQAALSGLDLILSDWGGHSNLLPKDKMVPLQIDPHLIPRINRVALQKSFLRARHKRNATPLASYREKFSYKSFGENIRAIMGAEMEEFKGPSELYQKYSRKCLKHFPFHFKDDEIAPSKDMYFKIYRSYFGK